MPFDTIAQLSRLTEEWCIGHWLILATGVALIVSGMLL